MLTHRLATHAILPPRHLLEVSRIEISETVTFADGSEAVIASLGLPGMTSLLVRSWTPDSLQGARLRPDVLEPSEQRQERQRSNDALLASSTRDDLARCRFVPDCSAAPRPDSARQRAWLIHNRLSLFF